MTNSPSEELHQKHCLPCEGGMPRCTPEEIQAHLARLPGWQIAPDGRRIRKQWREKSFRDAMDFLNRVAAIAESEHHHPDIHLEGCRQVTLEIWTHALGSLSENDFILAARIDQLQ